MKARVVAFSALAVIVCVGILGMHAAGFGHRPMTAMVDVAGAVHEPAALVSSAPIVTLAVPEPAGDGHAALLSTLCVATLSIALCFTLARCGRRARAGSRCHVDALIRTARRVTRARAGPPTPLLVPLRR